MLGQAAACRQSGAENSATETLTLKLPCRRLLPPSVPCCQWFALARSHVDLVLADTAVDAAFRAHCRTMFEPERKKERECYRCALPACISTSLHQH